MTSESLNDARLDVRMRNAYEAMAPTDDAQKRVLESLRRVEKEQEGQAHTTLKPTHRRMWWIALPAAACVLVALVVVSLTVMAPSQTKPQQAAPTTNQRQLPEESYETGAADAVASDEEMVASEENAAANNMYQAAPYKRVTTASGTTFTVGEAVLDEPAYSNLEDATAYNPESSKTASCVVADEQFVRFENDSSWYRLTIAGDE